MNLLELPIEVLQPIIEDLVQSLGLYKAVALRLVSKFFDSEVIRAIAITQIDNFETQIRLERAETPFLTTLLLQVTKTDRRGRSYVSSVIRQTTDWLLGGAPSQSEQQRLQYLNGLCRATVTHLGKHQARTFLGSGPPQERRVIGINEDDLSAAACVGSISFVRALLKLGINVDGRGALFGKPLQAASKQGHKNMVRLLLEHGADINDPGGADGTALEVASLAGHGPVVRLLLDPKYSLDTSAVAYGNAIVKAACGGHESLVRLLMGHGEVDPLSNLHSEILREAAYHGRESVVQLMLEEGVIVNDEDHRHQDALQKAAS